MSEAPQGPGWWQASDGRWYPPHTHPAAAPAAHPGAAGQAYAAPGRPYGAPGPGGGPGVPGYGPHAAYAGKGVPPMPPRKSGPPTALIVLGVVVVLVVVLGYAAVSFATNLFTSKLESAVGGDCTLVSAEDVGSVLGGQFDVIQLGGLTSIATPALDSRVLADATTCWATETGTDNVRLVRVARLEGDAAQRFQQERTLAQGIKEDRGGGITVESQPYFNKDVPHGDEAFCTTTDFTGSSGMLVRRGDTLIYVSLTSATFNPDLDPTGESIKSADDDLHCDQARAIADKVDG
ncbi:MAG TPA: hypothetical protein VGD67_16655 [Pseudonocardiaceae bacterium]